MPRPIPLVEPVTMADFPDNMAMTFRMRMKCRNKAARLQGLVGRNAQLLAIVGDSDVRNFLQTCDGANARGRGGQACHTGVTAA